jgi:uncharacterized protein (UPF0212 family)
VPAVAFERAERASRVRLPGGLWRADVAAPVREVELRPLDAQDEEFLLDTAGAGNTSARATALLARCLVDDTLDNARSLADSLTVGDREALLLHLRRLTLGETAECVLTCPYTECGEQMEFELRVDDLVVPAYELPKRLYEIRLALDGGPYDVVFRLPTAADLDAAPALAGDDPESVALELLRLCVVRASQRGRHVPVDRLSAAVRAAIAEEMAELDPQAELELTLACPACGTEFSVVFDTASFLLQELDLRTTALLADVHALALHYHWSERDILAMPATRRAKYLELLSEPVRSSWTAWEPDA